MKLHHQKGINSCFFHVFHNRLSSFFKNNYGDKNDGYTNYCRLIVSLFYAAIVETFIENEDFYLFCYSWLVRVLDSTKNLIYILQKILLQ